MSADKQILATDITNQTQDMANDDQGGSASDLVDNYLIDLPPAFDIWLLAVFMTIIGFALGASLIPFGVIAIASLLILALMMFRYRKSVYGFLSFFIAVPAIAIAACNLT